MSNTPLTYYWGVIIIEDLLSICRDLLCYAMTSKDLEDNEIDYILSVVRKAMFVVFIELVEKTTSQNRF